MSPIFVGIYHFLKARPWFYILVLILLVSTSVWVLKDIKLDDDIKKVVPFNESLEETQDLLDNLKVLDKLLIVFEAQDSTQIEDLILQADTFVAELDSQQIANVGRINYKVEEDLVGSMYDLFYNHLPIFLKASDYAIIEKSIQKAALENTVENNYKSLLSPAGFGLKKYLIKDPLSWTPIVLNHLQDFNIGGDFRLYRQRLCSPDLKHVFVFVDTDAKDQKSNALLVDLLEKYKNVNSDFKFHYFGASPVAYANQKQIKRDIFLTVGFAFLLVIVLISFFFKSWRVFPNVLLPVVLGAGLSLSVLILIKGEISALALGVGSVLLGITIDYALHIYAHFLQHKNVKQILKSVSAPILLSSVTTAIAFIILIQIKADAFTDLALFAALSVVFVAVFSLIIVPQQAKVKAGFEEYKGVNAWFDKKLISNSKLILGVIIVSVFMSFGLNKVQFQGDLLKLNFLTPELAEDEAYINSLTTSNQKNVYLSSKGQSFNEALLANEKALEILDSLKQAGHISDYSNLSTLWPSKERQQERIQVWNQFWQKHSVEEMEAVMLEKGKSLNFNEKAFRPFLAWLRKDFQPIEPGQMSDLRRLMFEDFISESEQTHLLSVVKMNEVDSEKLKAFYKVFGSQQEIIPFDKQHFSEILLDGLKINFSNLVWWSTLAVFLVLLMYYGRIELTIINMLPILISWLWTLGLAGWLGIEFNIFNIIISSLIFGLGIDYSISITQGMILENKTGQKSVKSFKLSVLFSALTTFAGVGVMIFAKHPALKSMALITVLGIASVLFLSFTLIPILFNFLTKTKRQKRKQPVSLLSLIMSNLSLALVWEAVLFSLPLRLVLYILPIDIKKKKYVFSYFLHVLSKGVVYMNFHIPKRIIGLTRDTFKKPSIIIANHQSQLDLVFMMMLHPKMIVITNKGVWNSPALKFFVRYADFYPILDGMEDAYGHLKKKMDDGYSVLIFPEGTRSKDGKIKRFHKGAFHLAQALKVDIIPIIIHGAFDSLSKDEFFLHKGTAYIKVLDKVDISDAIWGETLRDKTKAFQTFFRQEFENLKSEAIPTKYNRTKVLNQYIYKGPVLEWYAKVKTRMEDNYQMFDQLIAKDASIVDIGCGYGFMLHYLALSSLERNLKGFDYDADKIAVAQKATEQISNLDFDVLDISEGLEYKADVFILADILHYLPVDLQEKALKICYENLNAGGTIIVRDANAEMENKHKRTKLTEFLSTKVFRFNKTQDESKQLYFITKEKLLSFLDNEQVEVEILDKTKYLSNLVYLIKKK